MIKLCFIDTETTGLKPDVHSVWQVGGIITLDGHEAQRFGFSKYPGDDAVIDKKALAVGGITEEKLKALGGSQKELYDELRVAFSAAVDPYVKPKTGDHTKMWFIGCNSRFDWDFLQSLWKRCGDNYFGSFFWYPPICIAQMFAMEHLGDRDRFLNLRLDTIAEALDIYVDHTSLHNASYDADLVMQIFNKLEGG